jgi:alkyl hydroperoxide reductase subunit AhpF
MDFVLTLVVTYQQMSLLIANISKIKHHPNVSYVHLHAFNAQVQMTAHNVIHPIIYLNLHVFINAQKEHTSIPQLMFANLVTPKIVNPVPTTNVQNVNQIMF